MNNTGIVEVGSADTGDAEAGSKQTGVIVVGAGLAADNVAGTLREKGYTGSITLIGDELDRPYERPPLSKDFMLGKSDLDKAFVHDQQWYDDNTIECRFGEAVTSIDRAAQQVSTSAGATLGYQQLVIATGSSARTLDIPGVDLTGVHTLRRRGDAAAIKAALQPGQRLVVLGAGWIGLEVAAAARSGGLEVTVLEHGEYPLERVMGAQMGGYFAGLHRANRVELQTEVEVTAILGTDGRVSGVDTKTGSLPADLVLLGVGAVPNVELAAAAGLEVNNGILVDEHLRTTDPAIMAVGDVANAYNTARGGRLRVEHWDNAIRQGKLAALSILGLPGEYDWQPYFFTDQYDLGMEYVGYANAASDVVVRGDSDTGEFITFWLDEGRISAAMNVNIWDVSDDLRALIGREISADRLQDEKIPLGEL